MPFQYVLANLLAETEQSIGVLFLDGSGEAVDMACSELAPHQMQIVGAYLGIYLRHVEKYLDREIYGDPELLYFHKEPYHIYAHPLPEGYYLVLVQRGATLVSQARRQLMRAGDHLERELFKEVG